MIKNIKNIQIIISDRIKAYGRFALILGLLSLTALVGVVLLTAYTIRLDIAFMEANAMIKHEMIRADIMRDVFTFDSWFPLFIPLGLAANAAIAALFGLAQEHYFTRFRVAMEQFSESLKDPKALHLGPLQHSAHDFFELIALRKTQGDSTAFQERKAKLLEHWPKGAIPHLTDQVQFTLIAGVLAAYYSALCMMIFWHANSRIVALTSSMTQFKDINASSFFDFQFGVSEGIGWTFIIFITLSSCLAGLRFSQSTASAAYAIRRQLMLFLNGNHETRVSLRKGDPGISEIPAINEALSKIEKSIHSAS
jgi:hypothetical protein